MKAFSIKKLIVFIVAVVVGIVIAFLPPPAEVLTQTSMIYMGIFVGMIILLISNIIPAWASCLGALALMVVFKVGTLPEVYNAFAGSIVWLLIAVFAFSIAVINSGLLTRLALRLLMVFPKNYRGQVLSLMTVGTILSPIIPSSNAKVNLLIPIATEMTKVVGYEKKSKAALGLFTGTFMPPYIGSHAFLTGNANVAFMIGIMGLSFSWIGWLQLTWVWLIIILLGTYIFCMTYCKPKEKLELPENYYKDKYAELGKMTFGEIISAIIIVFCLVMWITQPLHGIDAGMVSLIGVILLALFGVLTTKAFQTQIPWDLLMFIGALIGAAGFMQTMGVSTWLAALLNPVLAPLVSNIWVFVIAVCIITWVLRAFIPANGVVLVSIFAIFSPLLETYGISTYVLCFSCYVVSNIWFNSFQNPFVIGTLGIAGNEYVTIKEFKKAAYAFMVMSLVAMSVSVPLWIFLGMC
jgi:DASS family divalent anion:Na+ symporter